MTPVDITQFITITSFFVDTRGKYSGLQLTKRPTSNRFSEKKVILIEKRVEGLKGFSLGQMRNRALRPEKSQPLGPEKSWSLGPEKSQPPKKKRSQLPGQKE